MKLHPEQEIIQDSAGPVTGFLFGRVRRIHFVGIGGIGMSGIAEVLLNMGFRVSGSDLRPSGVTCRLAALGGEIHIGHAEEQIAGADVVVVSSAVAQSNCEVEAAFRQHIPVIPRAEMLGELMRMKFSVAVAGSHGKTTTTSMIAMLLHHANLDPTVVIGGRLNIFGSNARLGQGPLLVAEADESDGSFLKLFPALALVTNIDAEHLSHFRSMEGLRTAFLDFVNRVPFYGAVLLYGEDPEISAIVPHVQRRMVQFGFSPSMDVRAEDLVFTSAGSQFRVRSGMRDLGEFRLRVPGRHNVLNALAAISTGLELNLPVHLIREALELFPGVDRRFQLRGECNGIRIVDDYGHHPTEIEATLAAARTLSPARVVAVFQPHRFSRVAELWNEFARAFSAADLVCCLPVYPAGEVPLPGITGDLLGEAIGRASGRPVLNAPDFQSAVRELMPELRSGDLVITFGAGNVHQVCDLLLSALAGQNGRANSGVVKE